MPHRFYTCDVFTDEVFGGNPLAVFPDLMHSSGRSAASPGRKPRRRR